MNVQKNKYSETNVIIVPIIMLNKAEDWLCFRIFIPVAISVIPPIKKITSNSNIGHFISSDLCMKFIRHRLFINITIVTKMSCI